MEQGKERKIASYSVDIDGNIIDVIYEGDRVKVTRGTSLEYLRKQEEKVKVPKGEAFVKIFNSAFPQLSSCGLGATESRVFFYLLENIRYDSNVSKYGDGTLITREALSQDLGLPISNVHRAVTNLCQKGLIAITKINVGKVFIVNPFVAMRGKTIDKTTYDLFKKTKWAKGWGTGKNS